MQRLTTQIMAYAEQLPEGTALSAKPSCIWETVPR